MRTLLPIFISSLLLAWLTEKTTKGKFSSFREQSSQNNLFFFLLLLVVAIPSGLRTNFNDTTAYIISFRNQPTLIELFQSDSFHILSNPAFSIYTALVHALTDNYHIYFLSSSLFVQYAFLTTIRRYSSSFTLGVGVYFCLGTFVFSLAAMKQVIAMSIALLALPSLLDGKYIRYLILVFIAFLFHTYALMFAVLPLFVVKPWSFRTLLLLGIVFLILQNFETAIGSFLDFAQDQGKNIADYEVFAEEYVNYFRVAVYAVVPLMSLILRPYLFREPEDKPYHILVHMSIISLLFMIMGTFSGANMFGRMANYFEFGSICCFSWIIGKAFTRRSARTVTVIGAVCFLAYFYYANAIAMNFDAEYRAVSLFGFLRSLLPF